ncbi:MAG TPA: hypothetical protein VK484_10105, partial [Ferruginibacter sp.]|nr:hypothetical protein [Ferruginibacter sp.]
MQNNLPLSGFLYRHSYLLIIAAWFITISFIIDNYWSGNSSVDAVQSTIENYIQKQEKDFEQLMGDTAVVNRISDNSYDEPLLKKITDKRYFIYSYFINDIGLHQLIFWNTQAVLPSPQVLSSADSSGFIQLENGYYAWRKVSKASSITVALIPVKWNYFVTNAYLRNSFATGQGIENNYDIS